MNVPNQGTMSQQNGNSQMQSLVGGGGSASAGSGLRPSHVSPVDNDILKLKQVMRIRIFNLLQQIQPSPADDASKAKYMDVARRLEEGLFKTANTKEDYMNQSTLQHRIASLIKGRQLNNYNQRHTNSPSVGTIIPTPGLQHSGGNQNLMITSTPDGGLTPAGGAGLGSSHVSPVDNDILKLRQAMRIRIFNILQQKQPSLADDASKGKYMDVAKRLEEGLFTISNTKEDYMNQSTLEHRLASLIKGRQLNNYNQQHTNSSSVGTIIPTPGLQHSGGNQSLMITSTPDGGSTPAGGTGLGSSHVSPVDNDILKLRQAMRIRIFNILQQKQPSLADDASKGKYMDVAKRLEEGLFTISNTKEDYMNQSTLEHRLASLIKGRQLNNYNLRHTNSSSVGTIIPTQGLQHSGGNQNLMITSSVDTTHQAYDNLQRSVLQGEGSGTNNSDRFGSGNLYGAVTSVEMMTNTQDENAESFQSVSRTNLSLLRQQQQQFLHQRQLKQQSQQQRRLISNDTFGQNNVASDMVTHVKHEPGMENPSESIHSQNQYQSNVEDLHAGSLILPVTSQNDMFTSVPQNSQQMHQMLHPQSMASESINGFSNLSVGVKTESGLRDHWQSHSQEHAQMYNSMPNERRVQEDFRRGMSGTDEAPKSNCNQL